MSKKIGDNPPPASRPPQLATRNPHSATRLAFYTAFAVTIYLVENFVPKPFPFMKLGLANVVILMLLHTRNFKFAIIVGLSKTFIGGFISGTLLSPTTLLSFSGSLFSLVVMIIIIQSGINFSLIGISILGAISHNFAQIIVVRLILIKENSIFYLTPLLIILGIVTGIITGYLAVVFSRKVDFKDQYEKIGN